MSRTHDTLTITRNGTPAAVVIPADDYESLMETLNVLNDVEDQTRLVEATASIDAGVLTTGDEMGRLVAERIRRAAGPV